MPSHIRLSEGITLGGQERVTPGTKPRPTVQASKPVATVQTWMTAPSAQTSCGHMKLIPVSPDIDPDAIIKMPAGQTSKMPTFKGLPACESVLAR